MPHRGLSYGALRHLAPTAGAQLRGGPAPQICFNYHGQWDARLGRCRRPLPGRPALDRSGRAGSGEPRTYLLDVTGAVQDGRLELGWTYSDAVHDEATVRRLAEDDRRGAAGDRRALRASPARAAAPRPTSRSPGSTSARWT